MTKETTMRKLLPAFAALLAFSCGSAWAQNVSPAGLWKTIDDHTGKPKSLVRIWETNGEYQGKVEKLFRAPDQDQNPKCIKCEGERKDQPIIGMTIINGMKGSGAEYSGGTILDPANGKTYHSKMTVIDNGTKLEVRGYIGVPLLGRTQTWIRAE
jgi:uncharacterized protein (DUF2147 family)